MNHDLVRIKHMLDGIEEIQSFIQGKTRDDLDNNRMLSLSIVHLLEIIGEAANRVTPEFQHKYGHIPWKSIVGMRNRLIHGYYDIDLDIVWKTAVQEIPLLHKDLKKIVEKEKSTGEATTE